MARISASLNYLEQDKDSGKYYLGAGALKLSRAVGDRFNFHNVAAKYAKLLADETNVIVRIALPIDRDVYYLDTICPTGDHYSVGNMIAATDPLHCTSCGKAMLAYMPESFLEQYFSTPVRSCTPNTITSLDDMRRELAEIRSCGYAIDDEEAASNVKCVGVPILRSGGTVVGALSISGTPAMFNDERVKELSGHLKGYVRMIENII